MTGEAAVVILAGGEGSRIGGGKPGRLLGGERLIDRALRQARLWSDLVAVAVRRPDQVRPIDAPILADRPDVEGPLGGLAAALDFAAANGRELVLTIPADMPFLPADLYAGLRKGIGSQLCAIAGSGGHLHPVCALWRCSARSHVPAYLESGGRSLRGLAEAAGFSAVEWRADPHDPFFNVNDTRGLAQAERRIGG